MCYSFSLRKSPSILEERFGAKFPVAESSITYSEGKVVANADHRLEQTSIPFYHANAFTLPLLPVIINSDPEKFSFLYWGLIPHWCKDRETAEAMRMKTMNARAETIFEKPSFREPAKSKKCLVLMDGFFEWREVGGKKYPYYIYMKDEQPFAVAGLWDEWHDKETGDTILSFSLITTNANPLLEKIHNTKKRMPAIIQRENERHWLDGGLGQKEAELLLQPIEGSSLCAHTISKLITTRGVNTNVPEVVLEHRFSELEGSEI